VVDCTLNRTNKANGFTAREADEQRAVAVDAIVVSETAAVALHHIDVVHAELRREAKGRGAAASWRNSPKALTTAL
jgi:hypothetical protein